MPLVKPHTVRAIVALTLIGHDRQRAHQDDAQAMAAQILAQLGTVHLCTIWKRRGRAM